MNWNSIRQSVARQRALIATGILLALAGSGFIEKSMSPLAERLSRENDQFLDNSIKSTVQMMIPVGVAKAAADVIEGSTTVVEWGDITQPILDYLDVAWRILILSLIVTTATKYSLLGVAPLANAFLVASLWLYVVFLALRGIKGFAVALRTCIRRIAGIFLLVYLLFIAILPLTIFGTARLSKTITEPLRAETFRSFAHIGWVFSLESVTRQEGFLDKVDAIKEKSVEVIRFCGRSTADIAGSVAKLAVVKILEGIVFPLVCFAFLVWLVRGSLYPALGLGDRSLARDDFHRIGQLLAGEAKAKPKPEIEQGE